MSSMFATPLLTPDDFLSHRDRGWCELVSGRLVPSLCSMEACWIAGQFQAELNQFASSRKLGMVFGGGLDLKCFGQLSSDPNRIRKASVTYFRAGRITSDQFIAEFCEVVPDLAIQVVSANEPLNEVRMRVEEFLSVGCPLIWVVNPNSRAVTVYRCDGTIEELDDGDELSGEDVLPGFRCRLADVFPPATLPDLI